jgi:dodecin
MMPAACTTRQGLPPRGGTGGGAECAHPTGTGGSGAATRRHGQLHTGEPMSENVYKIVELTGSSHTSMEDAVRTAIERANRTLRNLRWFQVTDTRGHIENGTINHWQVTLKIGFTLDDEG